MVSYVYTDGSCRGNGKSTPIAGVGVYFGPGDPRNVSKKLEGKQTNNVAELTAVLEAFELIKSDLLSGREYVVVTDSEYVIKCVTTYGKRCAENGWKKDIPNKELVRKVYHAYEPYKHASFLHVLAHTNKDTPHALGNAEADRLANEGATAAYRLANEGATAADRRVVLSSFDRVDLKVAYAEKEEAKRMGARWDPSAKIWYTVSSNTALIERFPKN